MQRRNILIQPYRIFLTGFIIMYIIVSYVYQLHMFDDLLKTNIINTGLGFCIVLLHLTSKHSNFRNLNANKTSLLAFLMILFVLINSFLVRDKILMGAIFNIIICAVIGKEINNYQYKPWVYLIPFLFLTLYILKQLRIDPDPNNVFLSSRNYVSFYLIITVLPYYFISVRNTKSYSLVPAIVTVLLSFYALGRAGMVASLLVLISAVIAKPNKIDRWKIYISSIVLGIFFVFFNFISIKLDIGNTTKFDGFGNFIKDGGRSSIISQYLQKMDFLSFLFGMNTDLELKTILLTYGHVHSSLLNFHSAIGVGSLLFFYSLFLKGRFWLRNNTPMFLLLLAIVVRSATDMGLLFSYFDYVFWMFLFSVDYKKIKYLNDYE